jgi:hypothetical protein
MERLGEVSERTRPREKRDRSFTEPRTAASSVRASRSGRHAERRGDILVCRSGSVQREGLLLPVFCVRASLKRDAPERRAKTELGAILPSPLESDSESRRNV